MVGDDQDRAGLDRGDGADGAVHAGEVGAVGEVGEEAGRQSGGVEEGGCGLHGASLSR